jgi:hypothetical protein
MKKFLKEKEVIILDKKSQAKIKGGTDVTVQESTDTTVLEDYRTNPAPRCNPAPR